MSQSISDGQRFPMACPACHRVAGMPFMAGTQLQSGAIKVGMRCQNCDHEWHYDMPITTERKRESRIHSVFEKQEGP